MLSGDFQDDDDVTAIQVTHGDDIGNESVSNPILTFVVLKSQGYDVSEKEV